MSNAKSHCFASPYTEPDETQVLNKHRSEIKLDIFIEKSSLVIPVVTRLSQKVLKRREPQRHEDTKFFGACLSYAWQANKVFLCAFVSLWFKAFRQVRKLATLAQQHGENKKHLPL